MDSKKVLRDVVENIGKADYRSAAYVKSTKPLGEYIDGKPGMLPMDRFFKTRWEGDIISNHISGGPPENSTYTPISMKAPYNGPYGQFLKEQSDHELSGRIKAGWSGRGRHALFKRDHEVLEVLTPDGFLGQGGYSVVQAVKCVASNGVEVRIAQKVIQTESDDDVKEILKEIKLMNRLKHPHVIQLVGTYLLARKINILMYPVGEDLLAYMTNIDGNAPFNEVQSLIRFIPCLSGALEYLHRVGARHMDLKSANIIVKRTSSITRVYMSDFGLSRDFTPCGDSRSSGPVAFTRTYVAPEVARCESRGRPADIFSLGAIFSEILTEVASWLPSHALYAELESNFPLLNLTNFRKYRTNKDEKQTPAFQCNLENVSRWLGFCVRVIIRHRDILTLPISEKTLLNMLRDDQSLRPLASDLVIECGSWPCCASNDDEYDQFWPESNMVDTTSIKETEMVVGQLAHDLTEPPLVKRIRDANEPAAQMNDFEEPSPNMAGAGRYPRPIVIEEPSPNMAGAGRYPRSIVIEDSSTEIEGFDEDSEEEPLIEFPFWRGDHELNTYIHSAEGIDLAIFRIRIVQYLGTNATVRATTIEGRPVYLVEASHDLLPQNLAELKSISSAHRERSRNLIGIRKNKVPFKQNERSYLQVGDTVYK
ncbi:MAG: hypothetical protein M1824_002068 [Vezdaea acicularis]|nr:MAG: hypothetical protein M1824_002068 [Vezdaea acicularis]